MQRSSLALVALGTLVSGGCASAPYESQVLAEGLARPLDLQLADDTVYSLQFDGSIVATPIDGSPGREIVAPYRSISPNQLTVEGWSYNLLVTGSHVYWTSIRSNRAEIRHAVLDATGVAGGEEVIATSDAPIADLALVADRVCWTEPVRIACVDIGSSAISTLVLARVPVSFAEHEGVVYYLERGLGAGDGALVSYTPGTGKIDVHASALHAPVGLAVLAGASGTDVYWLDEGTCTRVGAACYSNGDGALRQMSLDRDVVVNRHTGLYSIYSDRVVVADDTALYAAESGLWRGPTTGRPRHRIENVACNAIAAADTAAYCADWDGALHAFTW